MIFQDAPVHSHRDTSLLGTPGCVLVDHSLLHPDRLGSLAHRRLDDLRHELRTPENIYNINALRDGIEVGVAGLPEHFAFVRIDRDELAAMPNIRLYPGMPATVMIPTVQRTAFEYIVGPLVMSFNQSFRQK